MSSPQNYVRAAHDRTGHLWFATSNGVSRTVDGCATIITVPGFSNARSVALGASGAAGAYPAIYVHGTLQGDTEGPGVYRSTDEGTVWERINDGTHGFGYIMFVQADSKVFGRVFVATNGRGIFVGEPAQT